MAREIVVAGAATPLPVIEVARLEALRWLSMGAVHALNNAFTTVVGEACFLREEHKGESGVAEACDAILRELDRCAKLTHALLARQHPPQAGRGEVDLVRIVRDLVPLLRETLGRQKELAVALPDDLLLVRGEAAALELLVLLLVQHGAGAAPGSARLQLGVCRVGARARLELEIEADGLFEEAVRALLESARACEPLARNQQVALGELAERHGGHCSARRAGPCHLVAAVELPALHA